MDTFTIEQYRYQPTDPRLGQHVEHDSRSRAYAYRAAPSTPLVSVRHERHIPVLDQGDLGSCTANAGVGALGTGPNYVGAVVTALGSLDASALENLAVDVYSEETRVDTFAGTYPPTDTGSSGLAAGKVLKGRGFISGYQHTFSATDAYAALQVGPIIVGTNWTTKQFDPDPDGRCRLGGQVEGGHEYCVDEIDVENERVWFTNSWSESWGLSGRAYYTWADFATLLKANGDVMLFVPVTDAPPQPKPSTDPAGDALWSATKDWAAQRHSGANGKAAAAVNAWAKATARS